MALTLEKVRSMYPKADVRWESCNILADFFSRSVSGASCTTGRVEVDVNKDGHADYYVKETSIGLPAITQAKK